VALVDSLTQFARIMFSEECAELAAMERERANELAKLDEHEAVLAAAIHHTRALYYLPTRGIA
jgi:hypothetical protein